MKMTEKKKWRQEVEEKETFIKLKKLLTTTTVLIVLDNGHKF